MKKLNKRVSLSFAAILFGLMAMVHQAMGTALAVISTWSASEFSQYCAANPTICNKENKTGEEGTISCPLRGQVIQKVLVHAGDGQTVYELPHEGFSFVYSNSQNTVTVTVDGHRHDLSWLGVVCDDPQPSPSPSVSPSPSPSPSPEVSPTPSPSVRPSPSPRVDGSITLNLPGFVCGQNNVVFSGTYVFPFENRDHYVKFFVNGSEVGVTTDGTNWSTAQVTLNPNSYTVRVELWGVGQEDRLVASQDGSFTINECSSNGGGGTGGSSSSSSSSSQGEVLGATTMAATGVAEDVIMSVLGLGGSVMTAAGSVLYGKNKKK